MSGKDVHPRPVSQFRAQSGLDQTTGPLRPRLCMFHEQITRFLSVGFSNMVPMGLGRSEDFNELWTMTRELLLGL